MKCTRCEETRGLYLWAEIIGTAAINEREARPLYGEPESLCFIHFCQRLRAYKRKENEKVHFDRALARLENSMSETLKEVMK